MKMYKKLVLAVFVVSAIAVGTAGVSLAADSQRHVVSQSELQARIDQQISQADADRQAIQIMLQRTDVRQIAGAAGLDLKRASAAAAVLSGPSLETLAAQARGVNAELIGGSSTFYISATSLVIVLLLVILLTR